MNGARPKTSPWVYVGIGCGGLVLLGVLAAVGLGLFAYRKGKQIEADMKDPEVRAAKVREVLGGEIPAGYHPILSVSIPFLMDMAMLGDRPPSEKGGPSRDLKRGFLYISSLSTGAKQDELKRYFEGEIDDPEALRRAHINIEAGEKIRRGALDLPGQTTLYLSQRGTFAMDESRSQGITTLLYIDCPQDSRQRMGIWFGADPAPDQPVEKVDWSGTVADEAVMRDFLGHFKLCGK